MGKSSKKHNQHSPFFISGIQQVGVGTMDFRKSWNWFIDMFGFETKILEDDTVAERMLIYTDGKPQKRHACIAVNLQGGGGLEIWQYSERKPQPAPFEVEPGDLGIFAVKLNCRNVEAFHKELSARTACSDLSLAPDGKPCFFVRDLYGNIFQVIEQKRVYIKIKRHNGGIGGAMVGVTDIEASMKFYGEVLGYDKVIYDTYGQFADLESVAPFDRHYRRVLLATSEPRRGAFCGLMGESTIELVQSLDHTPRKIFEGRCWGDPGFIQICFDVTGMRELEKFCQSKGVRFTVDSCPGDEVFDMGEASGHFTYIEDPDGTLIEFVETHKIPVAVKLGLYIDLRKRDRRKPMPKFLFKIMKYVAKEKIK